MKIYIQDKEFENSTKFKLVRRKIQSSITKHCQKIHSDKGTTLYFGSRKGLKEKNVLFNLIQ